MESVEHVRGRNKAMLGLACPRPQGTLWNRVLTEVPLPVWPRRGWLGRDYGL